MNNLPSIQHVSSIPHEGKVVVIGTDNQNDLYYTVRQSGFEDSVMKGTSESMNGFEPWKKLKLDASVNDASVIAYEKENYQDVNGNVLITSRYGNSSKTVKSANGKVELLSALGHLYIFRMSEDHKLLVNRFILDGLKNELIPKLEVRYCRSKQKYEPDGGKTEAGSMSQDSLNYKDMDDNSFYEPAKELTFIQNLNASTPWFSVILLNTSEHEKFRWSIFVYDSVLKKIVLYTVGASKEGLFDLKDKNIFLTDPENESKKILTRVPGIIRRELNISNVAISNHFSATIFNNQVEKATKTGTHLVKEATRVMLAIPVETKDKRKSTAVINYAVDNLGMLAQIDQTTNASTILKSKSRELLLPLTNLDDITSIVDTTPTPMGSIKSIAQTDDELVSILSKEAISSLETGSEVKIYGTHNYDGHFIAKNVTEKGFEIETNFNGNNDAGHWEVVEEENTGLIFENMIASYEKTDEGLLKITCPAHNIQEGDEIQINGSKEKDGKYPVRSVSEDNSFVIDMDWNAGEVINLNKVKRRGIVFDGDGDYLETGTIKMDKVSPKVDQKRTISLWINIEEYTDTEQILARQQNGELVLKITGNNNLCFEVLFADGYKESVSCEKVLPLNNWIHVAGVVDYASDGDGTTKCKLVINGENVACCEDSQQSREHVVTPSYPLRLPDTALRFNGTDDYAAIKDMFWGARTGVLKMYVEAWINVNNPSTSTIISFGSKRIWHLDVVQGREGISLRWITTANKKPHTLTSKSNILPDKWVHVGVSYNNKTKKKQIFINGVLDAEASAHNGAKLGCGMRTFGFIGAESNTNRYNGNRKENTYFKGMISEIRIWDKVPAQNTIRELMHKSCSGNESGLLANWTLSKNFFNEEKAHFIDNSKKKYHATLFKAPNWNNTSYRVPGYQLTTNGEATGIESSFTLGGTKEQGYFNGKLSNFVVWNKACECKVVKDCMFLEPVGNEINLLGFWKLGGIIREGQPIAPDFSVNNADAKVYGEAYVSACELPRENSLGKVAMYSNNNLVAVTRGATYKETFEFRVRDDYGDYWTLEDIKNADGLKHPLFEFSVWGKANRTTDETIQVTSVNTEEFTESKPCWFRASCTYVIPEGISLIRCFEIKNVSGKWTNQQERPEDEWNTLEVRKHGITMISDSISEDAYVDDIALENLANEQQGIESDMDAISSLEASIAAKRKRLEAVMEEINLYENAQKFETEKTNLTNTIKTLKESVDNNTKELSNLEKDKLNYVVNIKGKESGKHLLHFAHNIKLPFSKVNAFNLLILSQLLKKPPLQQWEFEKQTNGNYKIKCKASGKYLTMGDGKQKRFGSFETVDKASQYWSLKKRTGNWYSIHNKVHNYVLDVKSHETKNGALVQLYAYHGKGNQLWQLESTGEATTYLINKQKEIQNNIKRLNESIKPKNDRLTFLTELLKSKSKANYDALLKEKKGLTDKISEEQTSLASKNNSVLKQLGAINHEPQTMKSIAKDEKGLETYGALLGFSSPAHALSSTATAEGNVQLSYFDTKGRMRFTNYDATADSANQSYQQWLPDGVSTCANFGSPKAYCTLGNNAIPLNKNSWSVETWFYFPSAFQADGKAYPISKIVSSKQGTDAALAIADNTKLGTVVNNYFHYSGFDMQENLAEGWHHLAAVGTGGVTQFYVNGKPVGDSVDDVQGNARYAMRFNGSKDYLKIPEINHDFSKGFTISCWVYYENFNHWSRIIDFGQKGSSSDNILLANQGTSSTLAFCVYNGNKGQSLNAPNILRKNEWMHIAVSMGPDGTTSLFVNGDEVACGTLPLPKKLKRSSNYIGKSNWGNDKLFKGSISSLQMWSTAMSMSEIKTNMYQYISGEESNLLSLWPMSVKEVNSTEVAVDVVESAKLHATIVGAPVSASLDPQTSEPINTIGNSSKGGSPAGKMTELRVWNTVISDNEIMINSKVHLTGNEPDLEAYYPLTDAGSGKAVDYSAADQKNGTYKSATPTPCTVPIGQVGNKCFRFNGKSSYLKIPGVNLQKKSFTIEFWALRYGSDAHEFIVSQGTSKANLGLHYGFRSNNKFTQAMYCNDINVTPKSSSPQWSHYSMVYDYKDRRQTLYIDGAKASTRKVKWPANNKTAQPYSGSGDILIGKIAWGKAYFTGLLTDLRIWDNARTEEEVSKDYNTRLTGTEDNLIGYWPLDEIDSDKAKNLCPKGNDAEVYSAEVIASNDIPLIPGHSLITSEYNTVGTNPQDSTQKRSLLRRFFAYANQGGNVGLLQDKQIEELVLKWIGNAQFQPTLLGYIEGAPPVPSENLTVNYDYDGATTVQLTQSQDTSYSWMRSKDSGMGVDLNMFLGVGWGAEGGFGIVSKLSEGKAGVRGMLNTRDTETSSSTIRANSSSLMSDQLNLRGNFETNPKFHILGNRYVPKNVGYALVVSGMADVFISQMKRTGTMIGYEVLPVEDIPLDINTITFMINPAYTMNGSLDGLVGSSAADQRFYSDVPEMRAQYGSLYPASYYRLKEAYDLKAQIERLDKERESYFINFDAAQTTDAALEAQTADESEYDSYGSVTVNSSTESSEETTENTEEENTEQQAADDYSASTKSLKKNAGKAGAQRKSEIQSRIADQNKQIEATSAFESWQKRMENLQIRAAKRNIVNTYVWDADGGIRSEEQSFANTVEHTVGGSFNLSGSLGLDADIMFSGFKCELSALGAIEMTQTMSKTLSSTTGFDLNIRLDGVERKGVTDEKDYPIIPGEKVDRYRFMSFYLEGNTDHFSDFFDYVIDQEWLMSNDEEARALRQVQAGRANKCWRVLHRVTYVERPALMGFGTDNREVSDSEKASAEVLNYFDALEQDNDALRADLSELKSQLDVLTNKLDSLLKQN